MDFIELKCQRCGGALEEKGGTYVCKNCGKKWKNQTLNGFTDMLQACEEAIRAQRVADIANLRQLLWKETHNEYVSNIKVSEYCTDILKYLPQDFYANFYLATCAKNKNTLGDFLSTVNLENHYDDINLILDYVLKALKTEWVMGVSSFIEKIKDIDMAVYNKYRTWFEQECEKVEDGVFEAELDRDVFLAYSSADMPKVIELVNVLEKNNITCFVAARNMRHGSGAVEKYNSLLHTAIDHCAVLVFVSSDNSRNVHCDAYREEISYIIAHRGNMPRVEYLIQNYSGRATERNFRNFFNGLEYCTAPEDVAARVADIIMKLNNEPAPKPKKTKTPKPKAQPAEPVQTPAPVQVETENNNNENNHTEQAPKAKKGFFASLLRHKQESQPSENSESAPANGKVEDILAIGDFKDLRNGYVTFGTYPQRKKACDIEILEFIDKGRGYYLGSDNSLYEECNGELYKVEPIRWRVLSRDGEWFLVSDIILDARMFDEKRNNYAKSGIRSWLNGEFYKKAFTKRQRNIIVTTTVDNSLSSTGDSTNSCVCSDTRDKIFLLSFKEAKRFFNGNEARKKKGTDFAEARGLSVADNGNSYWWLRSPYYYDCNHAQGVLNNGDFSWRSVYLTDNGVSPALKIKP